jgi:hypothetical protein
MIHWLQHCQILVRDRASCHGPNQNRSTSMCCNQQTGWRGALKPTSSVQSWRWWECVFSLKSFLLHRAREIGLLTGTSTQRSETGWILQPLKSLFTMFTQTAKWLQQLVMLTSSRCLHGILKIFRPSKRVTARVLPRVIAGPAGTQPAARVHDARDSRPGRRPCGSNVSRKD